MEDPGLLETLGRLALALALACVVGWDRELKQKPAGMRTHMLVGLGAAGFTLVGIELISEEEFNELARIIQGIIGGIGFLGAGTIIQSRGNVEGMTTAAGIWATAAMGVACGMGEYALAGMIGGLSLLVLSAAMVVEKRIAARLGRDSDGA